MVDTPEFEAPKPISYVLDTNVLIHDPNALLNFEEHHVALPMTVLEELDKLKTGKHSVAAECRQAIRLIDKIIGDSSPEALIKGIRIARGKGEAKGTFTILTMDTEPHPNLAASLNDNKIIDQAIALGGHSGNRVVLVTKDINMRLKARACGLESEDYSSDQLVDDIDLLPRGFHQIEGSFWDCVTKVESRHDKATNKDFHDVEMTKPIAGLCVNEFVVDSKGVVIWIKEIEGNSLFVEEVSSQALMAQEACGLKARDIFQALAMKALLDPEIHLVNLAGSAGSGKTILALSAAIEQTMNRKIYNKIIVTRSTQGLDEDIGFLPGTEAEKMEPWLGAIVDNLEALHPSKDGKAVEVKNLLEKLPLQFKSMNFMRGRSFQQSLIIIDECQNLTPHQIKTLITRAGTGSKVICLGNLAQIDTPYLSATSSGLTYLTERFKNFVHGSHITLQGVPRSVLAEYAEAHM
jgi:PhoH-like ATPase